MPVGCGGRGAIDASFCRVCSRAPVWRRRTRAWVTSGLVRSVCNRELSEQQLHPEVGRVQRHRAQVVGARRRAEVEEGGNAECAAKEARRRCERDLDSCSAMTRPQAETHAACATSSSPTPIPSARCPPRLTSRRPKSLVGTLAESGRTRRRTPPRWTWRCRTLTRWVVGCTRK